MKKNYTEATKNYLKKRLSLKKLNFFNKLNKNTIEIQYNT